MHRTAHGASMRGDAMRRRGGGKAAATVARGGARDARSVHPIPIRARPHPLRPRVISGAYRYACGYRTAS